MFRTVREQLTVAIGDTLSRLRREGYLTLESPSVTLTPPKHESHGDFACTVALALAKPERKNPREIAARLQEALGDAGGLLERTEIAGPGYLNMFVAPQAWRRALIGVLQMGPSFIRSTPAKKEKILVEFVSANPTGPLHVAHGRGAVTGDVVARLLELTGHDVTREYYVNDLGNQTDVMARSVYLRYAELCGRTFDVPEDFYPGEYIVDIAKAVHVAHGDTLLDRPEDEWLDTLRAEGIVAMLQRIKDDLETFRVRFDNWVSERDLTQRVDLDSFVARLSAGDHVYEQDGKRWFRSTDFGDDKDRVVVREDGRPTYFASDIAYHAEKMSRGYDRLINVWGADHGGYIARVKAGLTAMGHDPEALEVILVQMVSLTRGGEAVRMGKRLGTAVWLRDILQEAGVDATRYFFAIRSNNAQMDFDIDLATSKSLDNPVYYAQMGHARLRSIARRAESRGMALPEPTEANAAALVLPEELRLIKSMLLAPDVVAEAARAREPHRVVYYLQELIAQFHSYYTQYKSTERVVSDDAQKTSARLLLCAALAMTLQVLLEDALGVAAPEEMYLSEDKEAES